TKRSTLASKRGRSCRDGSGTAISRRDFPSLDGFSKARVSLVLSSSWYWPIRTNSRFGRSLVPRCLRRDSRYSGPFFQTKTAFEPNTVAAGDKPKLRRSSAGLGRPFGAKADSMELYTGLDAP